jgi:hypothetical protein
MSANGISTLSTKQARQVAKLNLAQTKRQGTFTRINNGSVLLDGTQCLTVPANSEYTLGTNDHTIEFWLYQSSRGLYDIAWNYSQQGAYSTSAYYLNVGSAGVVLLLGTGTEWGVFINPPSPSLDAWHHYAIVRYGNVFTLYVDGVGYSNTYAANIPAQPGVMSMGGMPGGDSVPGYFSNFRFVNGTAVYKQDFTPSEATLPNIPNTKILLNTVYGSNFLVDNSSIGATVTNVGNAVSSPQYPNAVVTVDTTAPFYRIGNTYDLTELPTQYSGNTLVDNINETGLIYGRPWVQFLPSDLFAAGEEGAWFDPGDIASLFQDTAGTLPVTTPGQSVALMRDKSGRGHNATQSTAGYRPTWQIDPYGYGYLLFDGVNDYMVTNNINLTGTSKVTASVGLLVDTTNRAAGIRKTTYTGYWANSPSFFNTATSTGNTVATNFTIASEPSTTSEQYFGTFLADYTGTWTFTITSDDESALWIGDTAGFGYTIANASAVASYSGPGTATINMVAGQYYLIRVMYGNGPSTGSLNVTYAHTGQSATNNFTGKLFYDPAGGAISTGTDVNSVNGTFLIGAPSNTADHSFYLRGTSTIQARVQNVVAGDDILTGVFDISQATKELELVPRLSGTVETDISWLGTNAGTGNFGNRPLYIGAIGGSATYFKGHIYGIVVRGALSNNTEITKTEAWINRKID